MAIEPREPHPQVARAAMPRAGAGAGKGSQPGPSIDAAAFERFYDDQLDRVYAFAARRLEDRAIAEELTTVAFERTAEMARAGAVPAGDLVAFTLRVVASAVVDHARRARRPIPPRVRASDLDEGDDRAEAEALSDEVATRVFAMAIDGDRLRRAVINLPEVHRRAILLAYFDTLAPSEVAIVLGCGVAEVPLRLHRALRALQAVLGAASTDAA